MGKIFSLGIVAAASAAFAAGFVEQKLDYTDQLQTLNNPDRGFYTPQVIHFRDSLLDVNPWGNFVHLRADISEFSDNSRWGSDAENPAHGTSRDLTDNALNTLRKFLDNCRKKNENAVVRFAYDP